MTSAARQLLLEVLLLCEKYSTQDIAWVRGQIASKKATQIVSLLGIANPQNEAGNYPRDSKNDEVLVDPVVRKQALVDSLRKQRSSHTIRRAEIIASRLKIHFAGQTHDELVDAIQKTLDSMSVENLSSFLKPYKAAKKVDEDFIDLAREIMKPSAK